MRSTRRFQVSPALIAIAFLVSLATSGCLASISRKGWNDMSDSKLIAEKTFTAEDMAWLRSSTTVFFLPAGVLGQQAEYEAALSRAWTLTPIKVVPYEERGNFLDTKTHSYLLLAGVNTTVHSRSLRTQHTHLYLKLMRVTSVEDDTPKGTNFCRIDLYINYRTVRLVQSVAGEEGDNAAAIYQRGRFYNLSPAHLALYLRAVERDLESSRRRWAYEEVENKESLAALRQSTLYVPDYVLVRFNYFSGDESERHDPRDLLSKYKGRYRIVSVEELNQIVAQGESPVFVFDFVRSSSDVFIAVYERNAGLVYRTYHSSSYNVDKSDFEIF